MRHAHRHSVRFEVPVQIVGETRCSFVQRLLQSRTAILEVLQHSARCRHAEMVFIEGAGKKHRVSAGHAGVTVIPLSAVDAIEIAGASGDDADRQTTADNFAVGYQISRDAKPGLRPGEDLVEDQRDPCACGNFAQAMEEIARLQIRIAALHRFDEDRGEVAGVCRDDVERAGCAVFENHYLIHGPRRDPKAARHRGRTGENPIGMTVIGARKERDLCLAGSGAR
jgi:hypothetical protein